MKKEIWETIIYHGKETAYQISNYGRVMSLKHSNKKILKPDIDKDGYFKVTLRVKKYKNKKYFVHRLVALYFVRGCGAKSIVNHIDGNKQNPYFENLEWVTHNENEKHASNNKLKAIGERNAMTKYKDDIIHNICKCLEKDIKVSEISILLEIPESYIYKIKNEIIRKDITCQYKFTRKQKSSTTIEKKDDMNLYIDYGQ